MRTHSRPSSAQAPQPRPKEFVCGQPVQGPGCPRGTTSTQKAYQGRWGKHCAHQGWQGRHRVRCTSPHVGRGGAWAHIGALGVGRQDGRPRVGRDDVSALAAACEGPILIPENVEVGHAPRVAPAGLETQVALCGPHHPNGRRPVHHFDLPARGGRAPQGGLRAVGCAHRKRGRTSRETASQDRPSAVG